MSLQECEICGYEEVSLFKCRRCGARFCSECGSPSENLCIDCQTELEE